MNRHDEAYAALGAVVDPELDEPITDLGFVRSLVTTGGDVEVHLRLPTSFCAPNFAYLMASDAKDVLTNLHWTEEVVVELDDVGQVEREPACVIRRHAHLTVTRSPRPRAG